MQMMKIFSNFHFVLYCNYLDRLCAHPQIETTCISQGLFDFTSFKPLLLNSFDLFSKLTVSWELIGSIL